MNEDLAAAVRSMHDALMTNIAADEALAQECAIIADLADQEGNQGFADVLRDLGRSHRIKALELTGRGRLRERAKSYAKALANDILR